MREIGRTRLGNVAAVGLAVALLVGCGGPAEDDGAAEEGETEEMAEAGGDAEASCVADYADTPCDLLTAELVRAELPEAPADLEQDSYSGSSFSSCSYAWPSDRMASQEVAGRTIEYEVDNTIMLSWIDTYETDDPRASFRRSYLPTEEEVERGREMMQEQLDEAVEEGELTEEQRDVAGDLEESVAGGMRFEPVEGAGDMASWSGSTLYVLDGATHFQIEADVSDEATEDREAAIAVANALIAACQ